MLSVAPSNSSFNLAIERQESRQCEICLGFNWNAPRQSSHGITSKCTSFSALFRSAANGCNTCQILSEAVRAFYPTKDAQETQFVLVMGIGLEQPLHEGLPAIYRDQLGDTNIYVRLELRGSSLFFYQSKGMDQAPLMIMPASS